ncbi:hypothetical protein K6X22_003879 [Salmonella enterica]|nr:hypothetical protein [Salmonella enterica]EHZ9305470.1 hypothetical protein [Salmonella enterica]
MTDQRYNTFAVGRARDGMTIDANSILAGAMRKEAKQVCIPPFKGACPAFAEWADKCLPGEKLPRGKYFRTCDFIRQFNTQHRN